MPYFEVEKCILNKMTTLVKIFIVPPKNFVVLIRRKYRNHASAKGILSSNISLTENKSCGLIYLD